MNKSFREVIRDIKNNEVWDNGIKQIECFEDIIQISMKKGFIINDYILTFSELPLYKKQRHED